jgi:serine/threonine-protein kinase
MSPEQARGELEALGPQSDVYSLGGTLYCLLTGRPPLEGEDVGELLRKVQRGEFPPPRRIDGSIDAALEAICLKAMALRPEGRYATPRLLAEDIERWMADEPVSAWAEPWTRKLSRWVARHRTGVTGASAAILAGVLGLSAVLAVQARANAQLSASLHRETAVNRALANANDELTRAKAAVQARYDLAFDAIKTFHTGVSEDFLLKQDQFKELRDRLLKSAADFYVKLGALLGKETDVASRRALAQANFELADLTKEVGRKEDALAAHRAVLARREALAADPASGPEATGDVGRSLTTVASLLEATGKAGEAEAAYREAEALLTDLAWSSPSAPAARAALGGCRSRLGSLLSATGKLDDALAVYRLARADQEALAGAAGATNEARRDLADTIHRIGLLLREQLRWSEAEAELRAAQAIERRLADESPAVTKFRHELAAAHINLADLLRFYKPSEAEAELRAAQAIRQKAVGEFPASTPCQHELASSLSRMGKIEQRRGRISEAVASFRRAVAIMDRLPRIPSYYLYDLACFQALLAGANGSRTEADRAMDTLLRAVALRGVELARMRTDTDLDPLRGRPDFRQLMMDLAFPAEPFSKDTDADR